MDLATAYQHLKHTLVRAPLASGRQPWITGVGLIWNATEGLKLEVRATSREFAVRAFQAVVQHTGIPARVVRAVAAPLAQAQLASGDAIGHPRCACYGTLGAFLVARDKQTLALSNSHVLGLNGHARPGDPVLDRYGNRIGSLLKATSLAPNRIQKADAALAVLDNAVQPTFRTLFGTKYAALGDQVYKDGATTGRTHGVVTSTAYTLAVNIADKSVWFEDQLVIETNPLDKFSQEGDSGSLIRDAYGDQAGIGLLFAGEQLPLDMFYRSYANPLGAVFDELAK